MKFSEILYETLIYNGKHLPKEYVFEHRGKYIIDTLHSIEREAERGNYNTGEGEWIFTKAIDALLDGKLAGNKEYLFVSKSKKVGMVVDYRKDKENLLDGGKHLIIVTWIGKKPNTKDFFAKPNTIKKIVESMGIDEIKLIEVE